MQLPLYVKKTIEMLNNKGYDAYAVGGCVRDGLLGIIPGDYDVCTNALPESIKECFSDYRVILTGEKHGTVTVIIENPVEITTFRTETGYSDNRHPDKVTFVSSVEEDLARRDFTVNSMAYEPQKGLIDPYHGRDDLENKLIRCVGEPDARFKEDGLRIMRALRFASVYGFEIEENTARSIHDNKKLLVGISVERLYTEMTKLLQGKNAHVILKEYSDVIGIFIPEILPMIGFDQRNPHHHLDVWEHTLEVLMRSPQDKVMRWSALLHDSGKPECYVFGSDGRGHFKGHQEAGARISDNVLLRLKCDNATRRAVVSLIQNHDQYFRGGPSEMRRLIGKLGHEVIARILEFRVYDSMAQSPDTVASKLENIRRAKEMYQEILDKRMCCFIGDLDITGNDILALGVSSGKEVGKILETLLEAVIKEKCSNTKNELEKYVKEKIMKV